MITKKPTWDFEAGGSFTLGTDELIDTEAYISGPLGDNLAGRIAINYDEQDGPTQDTSTGEGLNGDSNFAVRGSLLYEPTDATSIYLKVEHSIDDDEAPVRRSLDCTLPYIDGQRETVDPADPSTAIIGTHPAFDGPAYFDSCDVFETEISSGQDFFLKRDITTASAEISHEYDNGVAITSVTGFQIGQNDALADVLGSPENIVWQQVENDGGFFSQEVRLDNHSTCLLYTSPSPRDATLSRMPSSA